MELQAVNYSSSMQITQSRARMKDLLISIWHPAGTLPRNTDLSVCRIFLTCMVMYLALAEESQALEFMTYSTHF